MRPDSSTNGAHDPRRVIVVDSLTDEEAKYVAKYVARAFHGRGDYFAVTATGTEYTVNPALHELFFEAVYTRGGVLGQIVTTPDRNAIRLVFPPGVPNRVFDCTYRSGRDEAFDRFLQLAGGAEAFKRRQAFGDASYLRIVKTRYGEDAGLQCWRSMMFAVHPDFHGQGYGKLMHAYSLQEVEASGIPWFFLSVRANIPFYERLGCRKIGEEYADSETVTGDYPENGRFLWIVETGPTLEEAVARGVVKVHHAVSHA